MEYITFLLIGVIGGTIAGLMGIGGGTVIVPLLLYLSGIDIKAATAVSMVHIVFASISGTIFNYYQKTIIFKYSVYFGLSSMVFSFMGGYFTKYIPDLTIKIMYLAALTASLILMLLRSRITGHKTDPSKSDLYKIIPIGAVAGFMAGILGIGGGFLFVPALLFFMGLPMNIATGTSLGAIIFTSIPGLAGKMLSVDFNILFGVIVGLGGIGGARLGTYLKRRINPVAIRIIFILFFIAVFARVIIDILSRIL
ncbi:MAG: sulfite exporter TauE/SafE family protein [Actinobacteria bacterium]|nr:sulfite exporter TauE/SafE family protein [Actinomycetota bacterium]MBU4482855.1 sulfite exporter TauE/SafE family protein [Actinomycetota bacterium]MCG2790426.1 sulfite exporter TauE/SafE family protein [Actinomycetes bacterium]